MAYHDLRVKKQSLTRVEVRDYASDSDFEGQLVKKFLGPFAWFLAWIFVFRHTNDF